MPPSISRPPASAGRQPYYAPGTCLHSQSPHDRQAETGGMYHDPIQSFDPQVEHGHQHISLLHRSNDSEPTLRHSGRALLDQYRRPHRFAKGLALSEAQLDRHPCDDASLVHPREAPAAETVSKLHSPISTTESFNPSSYRHKDKSERHARAEEPSPPRVMNTYEPYQPIEQEPWTYDWKFSHQTNRFSLTEETWGHWLSPEQIAE